MTKESFHRWLKGEIRRLSCGDTTGTAAVTEAIRKAALSGLPDVVRAGQQTDEASALPFLATCVAACVDSTPKDTLTVGEAAAKIGIGLSTMYAACERGAIEHTRIGKRRGTIRINANALTGLKRKGAAKVVSHKTTLEQLQAI